MRDTGSGVQLLIAAQRILLFLVSASLCLARLDDDWRLATVVSASELRPSSALEMPVYAPTGVPVPDVPGVQMMAIQSSQLALIGEKTAYIIDKPGEAPAAKKHGLQFRSPHACVLTLNHEVMYYHEQKSLYVLDDTGEVCKLRVVAQEALHPEK
jgi:hypothetical protein